MNPDVLNLLRSPMGMPSHPLMFQILLVFTWTLHILAVHVMLGASALSIWGAVYPTANGRQLAKTMLNTAKIAVSIAIVLGVAPLLFVQTIYDPFWYVSNVLSARWVIGFVVLLLIAYYAMYYHYFNHPQNDAPQTPWSMIVALLLLLVCGFIMHSLVSQMEHPDQWLNWYAPNQHIDASGSHLHEFNFWRFAYFICLSIPITGAWLLGMAEYLNKRGSDTQAYLDWISTLGKRAMSMGGALALLLQIAWLGSLQDTAQGYLTSIPAYLGLIGTISLAVIPVVLKPNQIGFGALLFSAVAMLLIAIAREGLRYQILSRHFGYDVFGYPVHFDAYSTLLFLFTLLMVGVPAVTYSIYLSWYSCLQTGPYQATERVQRFGELALFGLKLWIAQYFVFGILTLMR